MAELSEEQEALLAALGRKDAKGVFRLPAFGHRRRKVEVNWEEPISKLERKRYQALVAEPKEGAVESIVFRVYRTRLKTGTKRSWEDFRVTTIEALERKGFLEVDRQRGAFHLKETPF